VVQEIKWTLRALNDLNDIYEFIAKDSVRYAQIQVEKIQSSVSNLAEFPLMGHNVPELPHLPYREILVGNYRILYGFKKDQGQVMVMSVVHGRRLLKEPSSLE